MTRRYIIRLNDEKVCFEEVPKSVFDGAISALSDDGLKCRYHHNEYIILDGGEIVEIHLTHVLQFGMAWLMRAIGVPQSTGVSPHNYVSDCPKHIKFKTQRSMYLLDIATGTKYKADRKAAA